MNDKKAKCTWNKISRDEEKGNRCQEVEQIVVIMEQAK